MSAKGCILLVIGLPAAGKTTFVERFADHFRLNCAQIGLLIVAFDEIIPFEQQKAIIFNENGWKTTRKLLLNACELFIRFVFNDFIEKELHFKNEKEEQIFKKIADRNQHLFACQSSKFLLLIEDNFYLRSMRYEWFKFAKQFRLAFAQIMIDSNLNTCFARNETRVESVPNEVISKMFAKLEKPNSEKYVWEKESLILSENENDYEYSLENILTFVSNAMNNADFPLDQTDDIEVKLNSQRVNNENFVHQLDCFLRKLIREELENTTGTEREKIAKILKKAKSEILSDTRRSNLLFPEWFIKQMIIEKRDKNEELCKDFVRKLLKQNFN
ncbi:L-seryl-tRNA(Sec) kinase-like protein [Dinothrombium tinctorium]|uniref:L-seryl-tRNA(Sec) kinase-like protein n=1 Tax=Dinothrombium tinctorium TaxID=1965070 RepID=A0A3S3NXP4_9ACAR|nr:L-seryl-tRNA(Sec) kinase-like protein [Dinothrombium tinctorium]RWS08027.1 L-seryl-tRNA(Sec) kinase-like protein [Dinothrombium tinctorium]